MYLYFIQGWGEDPQIKIGYSKNPEKRLKKLQTGCPFKLKMLGKIKDKRNYIKSLTNN